VHGELNGLQVVNIAKGEKPFCRKCLLDEKSVSKVEGTNKMAYVMQE